MKVSCKSSLYAFCTNSVAVSYFVKHQGLSIIQKMCVHPSAHVPGVQGLFQVCFRVWARDSRSNSGVKQLMRLAAASDERTIPKYQRKCHMMRGNTELIEQLLFCEGRVFPPCVRRMLRQRFQQGQRILAVWASITGVDSEHAVD